MSHHNLRRQKENHRMWVGVEVGVVARQHQRTLDNSRTPQSRVLQTPNLLLVEVVVEVSNKLGVEGLCVVVVVVVLVVAVVQLLQFQLCQI